MNRLVFTGALLGLAGVAIGAFGAHALEGTMGVQGRAWWETAVSYHLPHALAVVVAGLAAAQLPRPGMARAAGWFLALGVVLFSGSLYLMALTEWTGLGAVTPLGGSAWLAGWALLAGAAIRP
jgi:uncharacterized membrane protein YgdD (TMEM256/DUF423 family)